MPEGGARILKRKILSLLRGRDFQEGLSALGEMQGKQAINPLFSLLYHPDSLVRWRSVVAMGMILEQLAKSNLEGARVIMRRLMWSLNDESGGIGWGAPEVMGEAMARSETLANEYAAILGSYADPAGNFIEYVPLQRGVLWGWCRLSQVRPEALSQWGEHLTKYLFSEDPSVRGYAATASGLLRIEKAWDRLTELLNDQAAFETFQNQEVTHCRVCDAAEWGIQMLEVSEPGKSPFST